MSQESILLLLMLVAFLGLVAGLKWPVGLALAATSAVVAAADGQGFPLRHLVEGMFGYLDVSLVLITAMIFMKIILLENKKSRHKNVIFCWIRYLRRLHFFLIP